jgi:hypothetical protein
MIVVFSFSIGASEHLDRHVLELDAEVPLPKSMQRSLTSRPAGKRSELCKSNAKFVELQNCMTERKITYYVRAK